MNQQKLFTTLVLLLGSSLFFQAASLKASHVEPPESAALQCSSIKENDPQNSFHVTAQEYVDFLNHVATDDPYHLYDEKIASDCSNACIVRKGNPGCYSYQAVAGREESFVPYVSFLGQACYCNWLQQATSQKGVTADIIHGASYTIDLKSDSLTLSIIQHPGALFYLMDQGGDISVSLQSNQKEVTLVHARGIVLALAKENRSFDHSKVNLSDILAVATLVGIGSGSRYMVTGDDSMMFNNRGVNSEPAQSLDSVGGSFAIVDKPNLEDLVQVRFAKQVEAHEMHLPATLPQTIQNFLPRVTESYSRLLGAVASTKEYHRMITPELMCKDHALRAYHRSMYLLSIEEGDATTSNVKEMNPIHLSDANRLQYVLAKRYEQAASLYKNGDGILAKALQKRAEEQEQLLKQEQGKFFPRPLLTKNYQDSIGVTSRKSPDVSCYAREALRTSQMADEFLKKIPDEAASAELLAIRDTVAYFLKEAAFCSYQITRLNTAGHIVKPEEPSLVVQAGEAALSYLPDWIYGSLLNAVARFSKPAQEQSKIVTNVDRSREIWNQSARFYRQRAALVAGDNRETGRAFQLVLREKFPSEFSAVKPSAIPEADTFELLEKVGFNEEVALFLESMKKLPPALMNHLSLEKLYEELKVALENEKLLDSKYESIVLQQGEDAINNQRSFEETYPMNSLQDHEITQLLAMICYKNSLKSLEVKNQFRATKLYQAGYHYHLSAAYFQGEQARLAQYHECQAEKLAKEALPTDFDFLPDDSYISTEILLRKFAGDQARENREHTTRLGPLCLPSNLSNDVATCYFESFKNYEKAAFYRDESSSRVGDENDFLILHDAALACERLAIAYEYGCTEIEQLLQEAVKAKQFADEILREKDSPSSLSSPKISSHFCCSLRKPDV